MLSSRVVDDLDRAIQENQSRFSGILSIRHSTVSNKGEGKRNNFYKSIKLTDFNFPEILAVGTHLFGAPKVHSVYFS